MEATTNKPQLVRGCADCQRMREYTQWTTEQIMKWSRSLRELVAVEAPDQPPYLFTIIDAVAAAIEFESDRVSMSSFELCNKHGEEWPGRRDRTAS